MRKNPFGAFDGTFTAANGDRFYRAPDGSFVRYPTRGEPSDFGDVGDIFGDALGGIGDFFSRMFTNDGSMRRPASTKTFLQLSFEQALQGGKTEIALPDGAKVRLTIPKGVRDGFKIRLKERGGPTPDGGRGDVYVTFKVAPHPRFRREDDDLYATETINAVEAMLGTTRDLMTPYEKRIKVSVPAGTQPGTKLRLKGQGVRTPQRTGDLYVEIQVTVPQNLTAAQRDALRNAAEAAGLL
jgi:DnaJ-class molecular chaperone